MFIVVFYTERMEVDVQSGTWKTSETSLATIQSVGSRSSLRRAIESQSELPHDTSTCLGSVRNQQPGALRLQYHDSRRPLSRNSDTSPEHREQTHVSRNSTFALLLIRAYVSANVRIDPVSSGDDMHSATYVVLPT